MTMPKKGRREITVNDMVYHYKITGDSEHYRRILIQNTLTDNIYNEDFDHVNRITPKDIRDIILENRV